MIELNTPVGRCQIKQEDETRVNVDFIDIILTEETSNGYIQRSDDYMRKLGKYEKIMRTADRIISSLNIDFISINSDYKENVIASGGNNIDTPTYYYKGSSNNNPPFSITEEDVANAIKNIKKYDDLQTLMKFIKNGDI